MTPEELAAIVARDADTSFIGELPMGQFTTHPDSPDPMDAVIDRRGLLALLRECRMLMGEWTGQSVVQPGGVRDLLSTLEGLEQ